MDVQEEFTDEDFQGSSAQFDVDYLEHISTDGTDPSALARQSLYVKFDPLVGSDSANISQPTPPTKALDDNPPNIGQQHIPVTPLLDEVDAESFRSASETGELKYSADDVARMVEEVSRQEEEKVKSEYAEELAALRKELAETEESLALMRSGKGSGTLVKDVHKWDVAFLETELEDWRRLISDHEQIETVIIGEHEGLKSKVRVVEDEFRVAMNDFNSLENELDGLSQRYTRLREAILNIKSDQASRKRYLAELEDSAAEITEQIKRLETEYTTKVDKANTAHESLRKDFASKVALDRVTTKKLELQVVGHERELQQLEQEKQQLTQICDEMLQALGSRQ